ncbi:MAG: hypothetical protein FJ138_03275 [Deltaproteobacteria bacterium]|nr:hypothetical protein [Deltaproteobacteria bacterium]
MNALHPRLITLPRALARALPLALTLALTLALPLALSAAGCADTPAEEEGAAGAAGATPASGAPRFCLNQPSSSVFACAYESICLESIPTPPDLDARRAECVDDGGRVLQRCSETGARILGACNEGERLRVLFEGNDASQERMGCEADGFEWVSCP